MRRLFSLLAILLILVTAPAPALAADEVRNHVFLIDGSGSMEDTVDQIYLYSTGRVQRLIEQLVAVDAAFAPGDNLTIGIFSKTDTARGLESPVWVYTGSVAEFRKERPQLQPIQGWTDLVGTLDAGLAQLEKQPAGPAFLWLLTDNIDQDGVENENTERYYASLAAHTELNRIYVFPVDVGEPKRGLVLYAMVRERSAKQRPADDSLLDAAVAAINRSPLSPQLGEGGFLVRPLSDQGLSVEVVSFTPQAAPDQQIQWRIEPETGRLIMAGYDEGRPIAGQLKVRLTSLLPALKIANANIAAELSNISSRDFSLPKVVAQEITPTRVSLEPQQVAEYTIDVFIEPPSLIFSALKNPLAALKDFGEVTADVKLVVSDVEFVSTQPDRFFKVQRIPEILGNQSHVVMPVEVPIRILVRPSAARPITAILVLAAVLLLLYAAYRFTLGRRYIVRIVSLDFDRKEMVRLRRRMAIPGLGYVKMTPLGALVFVPDPRLAAQGEKSRALHGGSGQVLFKSGQSFRYEIGAKKKKPQRGGSRYAR